MRSKIWAMIIHRSDLMASYLCQRLLVWVLIFMISAFFIDAIDFNPFFFDALPLVMLTSRIHCTCTLFFLHILAINRSLSLCMKFNIHTRLLSSAYPHQISLLFIPESTTHSGSSNDLSSQPLSSSSSSRA